MSVYKKMVTKKGIVHFFKDGKPVDPMELPVEAHALLAGEETKEITLEDLPQEEVSVGKDSSDSTSEKAIPSVEETVPQVKTERTPVEAPRLVPADRNQMVSYLSGKPATRTRWLNSIEYPLTEEEYQTLNLGKLAQRVREKDAENAET